MYKNFQEIKKKFKLSRLDWTVYTESDECDMYHGSHAVEYRILDFNETNT